MIPPGFGNSVTKLLPKGGDLTQIKNYRPISLLPIAQKVLSSILNKRCASTFDEALSTEQAGFRVGYSTVDCIHTLNILLSHSKEWRFPLYLLFLDIAKAFDSVTTESVLSAMETQGVDSQITEYVQKLAQVSRSVPGRKYGLWNG